MTQTSTLLSLVSKYPYRLMSKAIKKVREIIHFIRLNNTLTMHFSSQLREFFSLFVEFNYYTSTDLIIFQTYRAMSRLKMITPFVTSLSTGILSACVGKRRERLNNLG